MLKLLNEKSDLKNLDQIVDLHIKAFPGFFLTTLGRQFLKLLYSGFIQDESGIFVVVIEDDDVLGFAAGTMQPEGFFKKQLKKKWYLYAPATLPGLIRNPRFAFKKCLGAIFYRGESPEGITDAALLSSLAVSPDAGRKGFGKQLVSGFAKEAFKKGAAAVYLTTDRDENEGVNRFYEKCGFELIDTFTRTGNRIMNRWLKGRNEATL